MNKRWGFIDVLMLLLQICAPVASIVVTFITNIGKEATPDVRLAILSAGIYIPVIILQITLTQNHKKSEDDFTKIDNKMDDLSDKINHISPIFEQIFESGNIRFQRFAYSRLGEVYKTIQTAYHNNNSGILKPNDYYEELLYLADLILKDKAENKDKFSGEIWAMTGFAEEEWIADSGYEALWTDKLKEIVYINSIKTRRLCLIPDSVYNIISKTTFVEPSKREHAFWGLIELLETYYKDDRAKNISEHYAIRETDNSKLSEIKGFFAIKLTNGDLHILCGETVDSNGALTARVLFDPGEIQEVRRLFERYIRPNYRIEKKIKNIAKSNGFEDFLKNRGIKL